eukprot:5156158-Karenia_brevis.AAC.1
MCIRDRELVDEIQSVADMRCERFQEQAPVVKHRDLEDDANDASQGLLIRVATLGSTPMS